jgi:CHAT domain-containing protein/tetratricopeptide (TPR) repeat protein
MVPRGSQPTEALPVPRWEDGLPPIPAPVWSAVQPRLVASGLGAVAMLAITAVALGMTSIAIADGDPGPEGPALSPSSPAETRESLRALLKNARYQEAEEGARRMLAHAEADSGPDSLATAEALELLVEAMARGGKFRDPAIRELAERAVAIKERLLGEQSMELGRSLLSLGRLLVMRGDYPSAKAALERALRIGESTLGRDHSEVADILGLLGLVLNYTGDPAASRSTLERAIAIQERTLGPDHLDLSRTLNNLGLLLRDMGELGEARSRCERALSIIEKGLGPDHPDVAGPLSNLANVLADMGDYGAARPLYERALRLREKALGPDHPDVAKTLTNLGQLFTETGDLVEARAIHRRALSIREKSLTPDHPLLASTLNNLGLLYAATRETDEARATYVRALSIREKALGPEHKDVAATLHNLADLLDASGDSVGARPLYERAVLIREKTLGPESPFLAASLDGLATTLRRLGDAEAARPLAERALAIREKRLGPDHPDVAHSLRVVADLLWDGGQTGEAREVADRAARILDRSLHDTLVVLPERQALRWMATRDRPEEVLFSGLIFPAETAAPEVRAGWLESCWNWTLRRRGAVLDELAHRRRVLDGESTDARAAWQGLADARRQLASLWVRGPDPSRQERHSSDLEAARRSKEQAEAALGRISASFRRDRDLRNVEMRDVERALPAGGVLVEIVRVSVREPRAAEPRSRDVALILDREAGPGFVDLGPSQRVETLVAAWREALQEGAGASLSGLEDAERFEKGVAAGARLREAVWDPIARQLGRPRILFLVPDGALHQVNLQALPTEKGRYLIETTPDLQILGSGRDLVRLRVTEPHDHGATDRGTAGVPMEPPLARGRGVLAMGAPDFDAGATARIARVHDGGAAPVFRGQRSTCFEFARTRWPPLRESLREVQKVGALLGKREPVRLLTGMDASEERFKSEAPGKRLLHVATHGFFLQGTGACADFADAEAPRNPLLLSGLVLAGANHAREAGRDGEDGILSAEELAALDLRTVELAVLSACETASGPIEAGEGVFGLRRALEIAGVRSVVMSLWPVPDRHAQRWMSSFYAKRLSGMTLTSASRRASLELLARLREEGRPAHPYLWAGFVTAGDWR